MGKSIRCSARRLEGALWAFDWDEGDLTGAHDGLTSRKTLSPSQTEGLQESERDVVDHEDMR